MRKFVVLFLLLFPFPVLAQLSLGTNLSGVVQAPIDANGWRSFKVPLSQNVTSFSFVILPNGTPPPSQSVMTVEFVENNVGGFTVTFASSISNPCTITTTANAITTCQFAYDSASNAWNGIGGSGSGIASVPALPAVCTPGTTNPVLLSTGRFPGFQSCVATNQFSNLSAFFTGYYGLSPLDTGATGNFQYDNTCTAVSGNTSLSCTAARFVCPFPAGTIYELWNSQTNIVSGTITCVNTTTVTLQTAPTWNGASALKWGSDDTVGLRSWAAGINAAGSAHSGYMPKGTFYTTKALRFVGPANSANDCNVQLTSVAISQPTNCGIWISGAGYTNSNILVATAGNFNWAADGTSVNTAPMYFNNWSGGTLTGFSVDFDTSAHTTSGQTGLVAGVMFDNVAHFNVTNVWVQGAHNTGSALAGFMTTGTGVTSAGPGAFESLFDPIIAEINDINLWVCDAAAACEKETYANSFFEHSNNNNVIVGNSSTTLKQIRFDNVNIVCSSLCASASSLLNLAAPTAAKDSIVLANSRLQCLQPGAPMVGCIRFNGGTAVALDVSNTYMESGSAGTFPLFTIANGSGSTLRINGGGLNSNNSCASSCIVTNNDAASQVFLSNPGIFPINSTDAFMFGGSSVGNIATLHDFTSPGVGFGGRGSLNASSYLTFTNCLLGGASGTTSPAACGTSAAGRVAIPSSQTTYTVNTTAVTANSEIIVQQTADNAGISTATCNTGVTAPIQTTRVAGTSFTISLTSVASVTCIHYEIKN